MEEHEKALISRQFIEVMLKVPVILCPGRIEAIETSIKEYFPDFIKNSFPFFITRSMVESLQTGTLYHITDFINLHFNLFLYAGGLSFSSPVPTSPIRQILPFASKFSRITGKICPCLSPSASSALACP